jgi:hypothetical protein
VRGAGSGPSAPRRALEALLEHRSPEAITALWWFPPLQRGRLESGLLAAALRQPEEGVLAEAGSSASADSEVAPAPAESIPSPVTIPAPTPRRILVTLAWTLRETGKGPVFESQFREEGEAPADSLPRILGGVARRMDEALGNPRYLEQGADPAARNAWIEELEL